MTDFAPMPLATPADDAADPIGSGEMPSGERSDPPAAAVSLMITRRQKEQLRAIGLSDAVIREMTPAEAHARLRIEPPR